MTVTLDLLFPHLDELIQTPADVQRLNEAILQLAVQGKLVAQDPQDEPAGALLKRIVAGRAQLVETGAIKQADPLAPIEEDEIPNEIPQGWSWVRFGQLCYTYRGHNPPKHEFSYEPQDGYIRFIQITDFKTDDRAVYVPESPRNKLVYRGEILMAAYRHVGKVSRDVEGAFNVALCKVMEVPPMSRDYLEKLIASDYITKELLKASGRAHIPSMHTDHLLSLVVPLPPLAEQKRIVAKVDELFAQTRALEAKLRRAQAAIVVVNRAVLHHLHHAADPATFQHATQILGDHFDLLYADPRPVTDLRQTILQLAVQGKLVPQDPHDEPAGALLKRIAVEKARLVVEGKIKKERALPPISDDEAPFSLPSGWVWTRLPEIGELARGQSKHRPRNDLMLYEDGIYPFIQTGDVARAEGKIFTYSAKYNDIGLAQSRLWPPGTLCITIAANIAETAILGIEACFPDSIVGFVPFSPINEADYFQIFMKVAKSRLEEYAPSTAQKNINLGILGELLVPLPPLNEIRRIVAKVDELLARCAALERKLGQAQVAGRQLTAAVLQGVVG